MTIPFGIDTQTGTLTLGPVRLKPHQSKEEALARIHGLAPRFPWGHDDRAELETLFGGEAAGLSLIFREGLLSEIVIMPQQEYRLIGEAAVRHVAWAREVLLRDYGIDVIDREVRYPWGAVYNYAGGRLGMVPMGSNQGMMYGAATSWDSA